jgi:hypothetical protein
VAKLNVRLLDTPAIAERISQTIRGNNRWLRNHLGGRAVTALPSKPYPGQEIYYIADESKGVYWHLYYAKGETHPWRFLGGGIIEDQERQTGGETTLSGSFVDLATPGPQYTIPAGLSGDWWLMGGSRMVNNTAGHFCLASVFLGATALEDDSFVNRSGTGASDDADVNRAWVRNVDAGDIVKLQYRVTAGIGTFLRCRLHVHPVRVG